MCTSLMTHFFGFNELSYQNRDLYTIVELRLNLSFEKKKKLLQIWRKSFLHFLGNWVADRTMKSRTIQAVPKFFLPAAPFFLFCSAKKGSLSDSGV